MTTISTKIADKTKCSAIKRTGIACKQTDLTDGYCKYHQGDKYRTQVKSPSTKSDTSSTESPMLTQMKSVVTNVRALQARVESLEKELEKTKIWAIRLTLGDCDTCGGNVMNSRYSRQHYFDYWGEDFDWCLGDCGRGVSKDFLTTDIEDLIQEVQDDRSKTSAAKVVKWLIEEGHWTRDTITLQECSTVKEVYDNMAKAMAKRSIKNFDRFARLVESGKLEVCDDGFC